MVTAFLRLLAPGVLLLLVATATTTLVQPAGGQSTSEDLSVACGKPISACQEDETCTSCSTVTETSSAGFNACTQVAAKDDLDSSTVYCAGLLAGICCLDDASEHECLANKEFAEYWRCTLEAAGCWGDGITCDKGSVGKASTSTA